MEEVRCPHCQSEYTYHDGFQHVCSMCGFEFTLEEPSIDVVVIRDANGNELHDGDSVSIVKELKVKGATSSLKQGTKVKSIRLVYEGDHNIDCKIDGFGAMKLKSEFVKKL